MRGRLFLTGGSGQIGLAVRRAFTDWEFHAPSRAELDLSDTEEISAAVDASRPDLLIHAAAQTNVDGCEVDPAGAERVNVEATAQLVAAAREIGAAIVYLSTDYVFDGVLRRPYREDDEPRCQWPSRSPRFWPSRSPHPAVAEMAQLNARGRMS